MSKKLRNALLCGIITSIVLSSNFVLADTNTSTQKAVASEKTNKTAAEQTTTTSDATSTNKEAKAGYTPAPTKTETVYVTLDGYGTPTQTQVVNGYKLTGDTKIVDYGNYTDVANLSNFATPKIDGDQITWDLEDGTSNFYYQGTLKSIEVPWQINVRYKVNGVEAKFEDLAGAAGMIETIINVKPNDKVSDYLKNNFFLQISTSYDLGKNLSVEAPDGIVVSLGDTKSITFMALPGEEATYHIYVGTDSFESAGCNFVMAPLQMSSISEVKNLKDAKTRLEDAGDAIFDSIDTIVDSTSEIQTGLSEFSKGLSQVKDSISAIRAEGNANDAAIDELTKQTEKLNESLSKVSPHFETAQDFVNSLYTTSNDLVSTTTQLNVNFETIKESTTSLQSNLTSLKDNLTNIQKAGNNLESSLDNANSRIKSFSSDFENLSIALENCQEGLQEAQNQLDYLYYGLSMQIPQLGMASGVSNTSSALMYDIGELLKVMNTFTKDCNESIDTVLGLNNSLKQIVSATTGGTANLKKSTDDLCALIPAMNDTLDQLSIVIDKIKPVQDTFNQYQPECINLLADLKGFADETSGTLTSATNLTNKVHQSVLKTKGQAYDSFDASIDGMLATIEKTIKALDTNTDLKKNTDIIQDTINNEWDRLEEDYNLLNYEPDAKPVSLVSDKNTRVNGIQIVLSTPEVTIDKQAALIAEEAAAANEGLWDRIVNIFKNMF